MASGSISATGHQPSEGKGSVTDSLSSDEQFYAAERSPIDDLESDTALDDQGTCIPQAHVNSVQDDDEYAYEMRWRGHAGRALGLNSQVTLPRRHPWLDAFPHPFVVMKKEPNRLLLQRTKGEGPNDVDTDTWRVDLEISSVSHARIFNAVGYFASRQTWPLYQLVVCDIGDDSEKSVANSIAASATGQAAVITKSARELQAFRERVDDLLETTQAVRKRVGGVYRNLGCNTSQQNAVMQCVGHWLTLVQEPPRATKTQVATALVRSYNMESNMFSQQPHQ